MKELGKWYENEKEFPCECLCKFKPNDKKYVVATIVKFSPNDGWYEFVGDNRSTYCVAIPISEIEALQSRSCEGCKYETQGKYRVACDTCARTLYDKYELKEQL